MINYSERSKFSNFKYVYTVVALKSITMLLSHTIDLSNGTAFA